MIPRTLTGITILNYNPTTDLPSAITDTFITKSEISATISTSLLTTLTGLSINSGNVSTYKLYVRIYDSTLNTLLDQKTFDLSSSNIINSFLSVSIKELTDLYDNEKIFFSASNDEFRKLYKNYKIVFRFFTGTPSNLNLILSTDIVQDINFVINTFLSGPYDVAYDHIDLCSTTDFSVAERNAIFAKNPMMLGIESVRSFYAENVQDTMPLIVYCHGAGQTTEGIDSFLSHFASYGYFAISVNLETEQDNVMHATYYVPTLIDHLKTNILRIKGGSYNRIDFTKIILCGLSRGGRIVETIATRLKKKNTALSQFSGNNLSINYSDLKCLVSYADVNNITTGPDGSVLNFDPLVIANSPTENELTHYAVDHDIPLIKIFGFNDSQTFNLTQNHSLFYPGFCYSNKLNYLDKYVILSNGSHNDIIDKTTKVGEKVFATSASPSIKNTTYHHFNSNRHVLNEFISTILYFFSANIFNSNKLKKIRFIQSKKQRIDYITKDSPTNSVFHLFYPKIGDILYHIDNFSGITSSLAGVTGFTFSSPLPFTYDYGMDNSIYLYGTTSSSYLAQFNQLYTNSLKESKVISGKHSNTIKIDPTNNDTFNGIIFNSYRSLFVPIESNISFGYTFTNTISLTENNYIGLKAAQTYKYNTATKNSNKSNFNLTLIDKNNNSATISSKNYSDGFFEQIEIDTSATPTLFSTYPSLSNLVFFRAGDFFMKNQSLGLTNINRIRLDFGPDYGSTFSHIAFDEFVIYKEL